MLPALGQKLISYLAPQNLQSIQMLIKQLCAAAHAGLRNLVQPLLPIARGIHLGTPTRNAPASIQRLEPIHDVRYTNRNWLTLFLPSDRQVEKAECYSAHRL